MRLCSRSFFCDFVVFDVKNVDLCAFFCAGDCLDGDVGHVLFPVGKLGYIIKAGGVIPLLGVIFALSCRFRGVD